MRFFYILLILTTVGCNKRDDSIFHHNIKEYQGIWRDTLFDHKGIYIEDLTITGNNLEYLLTNAESHIVYDKQNGSLEIGNDNKIGWKCITPIANRNIQTYWSVLELSTYQMRLYSELLGERNYKRSYCSSIDEGEVQDTLYEMLWFGKQLPLSQNDLKEKFGTHNGLEGSNGITYLVNHPLIDKIQFRRNYVNDSIYSYTLFIKEWGPIESVTSSCYSKIRDKNGVTEYCDSETLAESNNIVTVDPIIQQISFLTLKDYDYWPDISHLIGKSIQDAKEEYGSRYVYEFNPFAKEGLEYTYQTANDSIFNFIRFVTDAAGIITSCGMELYEIIKEQNEAQRKCAEIASFFRHKYYFDKFDEEKDVYHYFSDADETKTRFKVRLFLERYPSGKGYYRVQVFYDKQ